MEKKTTAKIVKIESGKEELMLEEDVSQMMLAMSFTNRNFGETLGAFVSSDEDEGPEDSHQKQVVKQVKWIVENRVQRAIEGGTGMRLAGEQLTINGKQLLKAISEWAKKSGIDRVRLRLKLNKVSEGAFQQRHPSRWTKKYKLKIYFLRTEDDRFPKTGTTIMAIDELLVNETVLQLLDATWFAHTTYNLVPNQSISFELVMRNPQVQPLESVLFS